MYQVPGSTNIAEYVYYLTPDGQQYALFGRQRVLLRWENFGMPNIDYITEQGPFQHGETVRDFRLRPRFVTLELYESGCVREDWYCYEGRMINALRPNRHSQRYPGGLLLVLRDGTQRTIPAFINRGPDGSWDGTGTRPGSDLQETMQFYCPDPVWEDHVDYSVEAALGVSDSCLGSLCLPACIGSSIINEDFDIAYGGTWEGDKLSIAIVGPIANPTITNNTTGRQIRLSYEVSNGETVTIAVLPNRATVLNNSEQNLIGTVDNLSDLHNFNLAAEGDLTADGVNQINISGANGVQNISSIQVTYRTRFIGAFDPTCDHLYPSTPVVVEPVSGWPLFWL
jgi:hypothetical protein